MRCGATKSCIVNERGCDASENDGAESVSWEEKPSRIAANPSASGPVTEWLLTTYTGQQKQAMNSVYVTNAPLHPSQIAVLRGGEGVGEREGRKPHDWIQLPEKLTQ